MKQLFALTFILAFHVASAQSLTHPLAEQILLGNYNPALYTPSQTFSKQQLVQSIWSNINTDSIFGYLKQLSSFYNRNTGADTLSETKGMGAARRWIFNRFNSFSVANQNRLIASYHQFDKAICGQSKHRNILAILPGTDTSDKSIILVEAHMDSRCEDVCDTACMANGMEDNGSGTALVIELARVMSKYAFKNTIVFMATVGEEQGLDGATAFATYCAQKGIKIEAVLNNDIVGGILCGKTASPPGCPGENTIDSSSVRLFSFGTNLSVHKNLARFIKLQFKEEAQQVIDIPYTVHIMNAEDRTGRGGDHIPFRQLGFASIRTTSAHEHGDAQINTNYSDRQHSTRDVLGKDNNADGTLDSLYVNMNYLKRNIMVNANALAMAAIGPPAVPQFELGNDGNGITIRVSAIPGINQYRAGIRTTRNDFDTILEMNGITETKLYGVKKDTFYFITVMAVDASGIESRFAQEKQVKAIIQAPTGIQKLHEEIRLIELLPAAPNPFDETTTIGVMVSQLPDEKKAVILISDAAGKNIAHLPFTLQTGLNEILYEHGFGQKGLYYYTLQIGNKIYDTRKLIFNK
ncbi:MAG: M28 family peptidase [Bacteroidota bacterium]|jgi:hypothetical protein|nr:M28 family peptidase [Sphingobacteriales bacterium]